MRDVEMVSRETFVRTLEAARIQSLRPLSDRALSSLERWHLTQLDMMSRKTYKLMPVSRQSQNKALHMFNVALLQLHRKVPREVYRREHLTPVQHLVESVWRFFHNLRRR